MDTPWNVRLAQNASPRSGRAFPGSAPFSLLPRAVGLSPHALHCLSFCHARPSALSCLCPCLCACLVILSVTFVIMEGGGFASMRPCCACPSWPRSSHHLRLPEDGENTSVSISAK